MGLTGVAAGLAFGVRQWLPLAFLALAASTVFRVWTAFAVWSMGRPEWTPEAWIGLSTAVLIYASIRKWQLWRPALGAIGVFGAGSVVALATKYLFDIGERHHSDSANVLALAVVAIQGDMADTSPISGAFKRGIAYPLMLGLGPEGRILSAYTPLVYLALLLATGWIAWQIVRHHVSWEVFAVVATTIGIFSLSVPMFRAAMFYLNGHTLMAFALILMVGGFLLARRDQAFSTLPTVLTLFGGVLGATARIEGIALVLILVVALVDQKWWRRGDDRLRLFASLGLIGLSLTWWLSSLNSPVLDRFGLSDWILVGLSVVGAGLAASKLLDPLRGWLVPLIALVIIGLLGRVVWQSGDPLRTVLAQWPNLGLGRGGWGTAAHVFLGSAVLLGWKSRSTEYRWLFGLSTLIIGAILFTKTFDGGFGREGFYDSVNRMWIHVMPVILASALVGYSELISSVRQSRDRAHRSSGTEATATTTPAN